MRETADVRVIHVDDEPDFADTVADLLEREDDGFTVETATSASQGLNQLADHDVDCIVSDYDMPDQNGIEFLETVRETAPDLPFILFTGKGSEEVAGDAISAGVTDYLRKERGTDQYTVLANRVRNAVERYRAEHARERQRKASETTQEGISILDEDGDFIYVNQAYAELYGYDPEELLGEHWELIYPDDEVEFGRTEILPTVAQEGVWSGETNGRRADGTTFPEDHRVVQTDSGELICSVRDLSAEQALRIERTRFGTLVETLSDPVYVLDETGRFEYVNDALVEMVGYDRGTILGETPALIKSDQAIERAETHLGRLLSSDGPDTVQFTIEIQPEDGPPIPCEDHMGILPYRGDCFEGSVGILRDITEREERERELKQRNQRLDEFASVVSHDLRNPLNVAVGGIDLARSEWDSEHLERAERALDRMEALIEDLLTLARGDETVTELEPVDLAEITEQCWANVETMDATLVADSDCRIYADANRLKQMGENLVHNAIEHGGDDVTVTVGEFDGGFYIEDDGPGIPEDEHDDVFAVGYSTSDGGTGFGLSIVERIVEAHNWELCITDGSDGGARFEVTGVEFVSE
ncbi:PAS domain S-box protein [Haloarcula sp. S1CR25-12]|uniref:histidine kinase n=1 Tax=Haloarcula saliterrae TaxID=2950534 RepID=A0ABU2FGY9_9EURY|nr:PAS domain S-box protein [Haloarcula sp. S1CR25-12]MDS0261061.1 PAS domain S-box protein [Haloarcula sp. S1CR25-12]